MLAASNAPDKILGQIPYENDLDPCDIAMLRASYVSKRSPGAARREVVYYRTVVVLSSET